MIESKLNTLEQAQRSHAYPYLLQLPVYRVVHVMVWISGQPVLPISSAQLPAVHSNKLLGTHCYHFGQEAVKTHTHIIIGPSSSVLKKVLVVASLPPLLFLESHCDLMALRYRTHTKMDSMSVVCYIFVDPYSLYQVKLGKVKVALGSVPHEMVA